MIFSSSFKAIMMMVAAVFLIAAMNASAKFASDYHNPIEVVFYRGVFAFIMMTLWLVITGRYELLKTERPLSQLSRSFIGNISVCLVFWAYALMPMTEVTALMLTNGLIITALSAFILKEKVGLHRWTAVAVGLLGALIVAQPSTESFNALGVAVACAAAITTSFVAILLRSLGKTEHAFTTVYYFVVTGTLTTGIYMIFNGHWPHPHALIALAFTGFTSLASLLLKTESYRMADASLLGPCQYTALIWAAVLGWAVFHHVPSPPVIIGSGLILLSNIVVLWREKTLKMKHTSQTPPPS